MQALREAKAKLEAGLIVASPNTDRLIHELVDALDGAYALLDILARCESWRGRHHSLVIDAQDVDTRFELTRAIQRAYGDELIWTYSDVRGFAVTLPVPTIDEVRHDDGFFSICPDPGDPDSGFLMHCGSQVGGYEPKGSSYRAWIDTDDGIKPVALLGTAERVREELWRRRGDAHRHYRDGQYRIEVNNNMPDRVGFLLHDGRTVGGYQREIDGRFSVTVDKPLDNEGSDSLLVGMADTMVDAQRVLWTHRHMAWLGE